MTAEETARAFADEAEQRACAIADKIVPAYRTGPRSYSCSGHIAKKWEAAFEGAFAVAAQGSGAAGEGEPFQARVQPWLMACFGEMIAGDREERNHRFLEEALELVQACGCSDGEAHQLVNYVFGRDVGEPAQEVGGVMVTLAALCLANDLDMHVNAETELARIWTKVEAIRAKQAAKPKHSPLPAVSTAALAPGPLYTYETAWEELVEKDDRTSPEEYPDMCLITREELRGYMEAREAPAPRQGDAFDPNASVSGYVADYVMTTEGSDYVPTEHERALIEDAMHGWLSEHWPQRLSATLKAGGEVA